ncbi:MAG: hypothetical protein WCH99_04770 [Verrucomicrobiota bacterium]
MRYLGDWKECWHFNSGVSAVRQLHGRKGFCGGSGTLFCSIAYDTTASFSSYLYDGEFPGGDLNLYDHGNGSLSGSNTINKLSGKITYNISLDSTFTLWNEARTESNTYTVRNGHSFDGGPVSYPKPGLGIDYDPSSDAACPAPVHTLSGGYDSTFIVDWEPVTNFSGGVGLEGGGTMVVNGYGTAPHSGLAITMAALVEAMKDDAHYYGIDMVTYAAYPITCTLEEFTETISETSIRRKHTTYVEVWTVQNRGTTEAPDVVWEITGKSTEIVENKVDLSVSNSFAEIMTDCESNLLGAVGLLTLENGTGKAVTRDEDTSKFLPGSEELKESWSGGEYVPHATTAFTGEIVISDGGVLSCRRKSILTGGAYGSVESTKFAEGMILRDITPYDDCDGAGNLVLMEWRELAGEDADAVVITDKSKSFDRFAWQAAGRPLCFCCTPNGEGTGYDFTKAISALGDQQWLGIVQHMTYDGYLVDARASAYDTDPTVTTHC